MVEAALDVLVALYIAQPLLLPNSVQLLNVSPAAVVQAALGTVVASYAVTARPLLDTIPLRMPVVSAILMVVVVH